MKVCLIVRSRENQNRQAQNQIVIVGLSGIPVLEEIQHIGHAQQSDQVNNRIGQEMRDATPTHRVEQHIRDRQGGEYPRPAHSPRRLTVAKFQSRFYRSRQIGHEQQAGSDMLRPSGPDRDVKQGVIQIDGVIKSQGRKQVSEPRHDRIRVDPHHGLDVAEPAVVSGRHSKRPV